MRRYLATVALLAVTTALVWLQPPVDLAVGRGVLRAVPARFGDWNGTELSFEDAVVEDLRSDDLLIRRYERGGERVWLCIVYHQNRRYGAHDPRLCYESQGYVLGRETLVTVDDGTRAGLRANRFVADHPKRRRLVYYWWSTRGLSTPDVYSFRGRMALLGALDNRSWGAFVRVETPCPAGDEAAAEARLARFASAVARQLPGVFATAERDATPPPSP